MLLWHSKITFDFITWILFCVSIKFVPYAQFIYTRMHTHMYTQTHKHTLPKTSCGFLRSFILGRPSFLPWRKLLIISVLRPWLVSLGKISLTAPKSSKEIWPWHCSFLKWPHTEMCEGWPLGIICLHCFRPWIHLSALSHSQRIGRSKVGTCFKPMMDYCLWREL